MATQEEEDRLAVTVATNDDAGELNRAVRDRRVQAGLVDDVRVAAVMDGARIGVGDRIVTRRNDAAADVANRGRECRKCKRASLWRWTPERGR